MAGGISSLHPRLQEKIKILREKTEAENLALGIGECFRSVEEQNERYAQGRTKPGPIITNAPGWNYSSQHQWGIAFDFYKDVEGHAFDDNSFFARVGQIGKSIGLGWGGDWASIVDRPHLYLPDWGSTTAVLKEEYGTFDVFRATWGSAQKPPADWKAVGTAVCTANGVRYRTGPGTSYTILGELNSGNRFEVDGQKTDGWVHIKVQNTVGWISGRYVKYDDSDGGQSSPEKQELVKAGQIHCNNFCSAGLTPDGIRGAATVKGGVRALQQAMNMDYSAGLTVDGIWGRRSEQALDSHTVRKGEKQYMVTALEILLLLKGFDPDGVESPGVFGNGCEQAVRAYQAASGLSADAIAGHNTYKSLIL